MDIMIWEGCIMSIGSFDDILKRARQELSGEERLRLIEALSKTSQSSNGGQGIARSLFDALNDRGLVGFMHDGPSDLSTNPVHMEGFGQHAE
jgi:hypothetical protein